MVADEYSLRTDLVYHRPGDLRGVTLQTTGNDQSWRSRGRS
jgi:hypothetical protein